MGLPRHHLVARLTGLYSVFLAPLFLVRALYDRDRERLNQFFILACVAVVHLVLILSAASRWGLQERAHWLDPSILGATVWTQTVAFMAGGDGAAAVLYHTIAGVQGWPLEVGEFALLIVAVAVAAFVAWDQGPLRVSLFLGA